MQKIHFSKYQGAGNDFVLIDNRDCSIKSDDYTFFKRLCDRRFGIGADGLMLLENPNGTSSEYNFQMRYYNADGLEGSMCGNGGRCIVRFARDLNIINDKAVFLAVDGKHIATIDRNAVKLKMMEVSKISRDEEAYVLNTGSPHYVQFVEEVSRINVHEAGKSIRFSEKYNSQGINVNFVEISKNEIMCRTYERGVEDETLACGTGATAAAIATSLKKNLTGAMTIPVRVLGGILEVSFIRAENNFSDIWLYGPAEFVFEGQVNIPL